MVLFAPSTVSKPTGEAGTVGLGGSGRSGGVDNAAGSAWRRLPKKDMANSLLLLDPH
jgi:hypothetical protein